MVSLLIETPIIDPLSVTPLNKIPPFELAKAIIVIIPRKPYSNVEKIFATA